MESLPPFPPPPPPDVSRPARGLLYFLKTGAGLVGRLILGLIVLAVIAGAAGWVFLRASLPPASGSFALDGLRTPITVWRDRWGVPTIRAGSVEDAVRALGFVHASERLWQMELRRRAASGTLSEILGEATVAMDVEYRRFGLAALGRNDFERAPKEIRGLTRAYVQGVNDFLSRRRWALPPEFLLLRFRPKPWAPEECFAFARLMMLNLTQSRDFERARFDRFRLLGERHALDLIRLEPGGPAEPFRPTEIPDYFQEEGRRAAGGSPAPGVVAPVIETLPAPGAGSNAFAIGPEKTASRGAILASDPHLPVEMPGAWFEAGILSPELEARGLTLAGLPGIVIGRNRHLAWGITVHQADDTDLFLEKIDASSSPPRVLRASGWQPLRRTVVEIPVRGGKPVQVELLDSDRGYILPAGSGAEAPPAFSVSCAALRGDNPIPAFWRILAASDVRALIEALRGFTGTPLNFTFADDAGSVGSHTAGFVPRRKAGDGRLPTPGWLDTYGWEGRIPFESLPGSIRRAGAEAAATPAVPAPASPDAAEVEDLDEPEPGPASATAFSVTANNRLFRGAGPDPYPGEWAPPFRAERIAQVLSASDGWTAEKAARLQTDVFSGFARRMVKAIGAALAERPATRPLPDGARLAMQALSGWDFRMERHGPARLFSESSRALNEVIAGDEAREAGSGPVVSAWGLLGILEGKAREDWFDDVTTPQREARWETVAKGLSVAWERTIASSGDDPGRWNWAAIHRVAFEHPLGRPAHLSRWLDLSPVGMPGDSDTVNAQAWSIHQPFRVALIPSARLVFDLVNPDRSLAVLVPGQSGNPMSPHYSDQLRVWASGATRPAPFNEAAVKAAAVEKLDLVPEKEFR